MVRASWIPRGLDARLVLPGLAVALAIVALWWNLFDRLQREERLLELTIRQNTAILARLVEEHAVTTFRLVDDLLLDVTRSDNPTIDLQLNNQRMLEEGLVAAVRLYGAQGTLRSVVGNTARGGLMRESIAALEEFQQHRNAPDRGLFIGRPYMMDAQGNVMIPVSRRISTPDGRFAGVAVADVPTALFSRFYAMIGMPADSAVILLRADGMILARQTLQERFVGTTYPESEFWAHLAEHSIGTYRGTSPVDGVERISTYRSTARYPLIVMVGESVENTFEPWRESARLYIGWAGAATATILLFTTGFLIEFQRRRRSETALGIRNHAMASSGDGILVADATRPDLPILYSNPAFERLMGLPLREIAGQALLRVLEAPLPDASALHPLREAIAHNRSLTVEILGPRPDADAGRWLELRASPVRDEGGRLVSLIAIFRDVSERKRGEAALVEARREAERANAAKSTFLAAASHDLRQPVQSLFLLLEVLSNRTSDAVSRNVLGTMDRALGALKMLLDGLLDVSRLEAGAIEPNPTVFPIRELLERVSANSAPVAVRKNLTLHIVPCCAHVHSDPMLLGRILQNFVENALRYTETGRVLVDCRRRGGSLRIEVWDTGIGIPTELQEDIFQEFVQVGNVGRNRDQGLGLGLAVVRRLAQMLGHTVTLRSAPGQGSVFAVTVPLAEAPAETPASTTVPEPTVTRTGRILVVENDTIVREGMRAMLREWGHEVETADGHLSALNHAETGAGPDIVITDHRLRDGETGTELIRDLRRLLGRPVPSILLTGDTAPERLWEAEAGDFRIMHKPVIAADLRRAIADALNSAARESETVG